MPETVGSLPRTPPQRRPVPASVIRAARLRREGKLCDAIADVSGALSEARATPFEVPFRDRVLLSLTLADLFLLANQPDHAQDLLDGETSFAQQILDMIQTDGTPDQIRAAKTGCLQLRDRATQLNLLGHVAPEIAVTDWLIGGPTTLADLRGRVVLIEFWARWCRSCIAMMPALRELHDRHHERGLTILALTRFGPAEHRPASERLTERGLIMQVVADCPEVAVGIAPNGQTQQAFGANRMPAFALVDRDGIVRFASSTSDHSKVEKSVLELLGN